MARILLAVVRSLSRRRRDNVREATRIGSHPLGEHERTSSRCWRKVSECIAPREPRHAGATPATRRPRPPRKPVATPDRVAGAWLPGRAIHAICRQRRGEIGGHLDTRPSIHDGDPRRAARHCSRNLGRGRPPTPATLEPAMSDICNATLAILASALSEWPMRRPGRCPQATRLPAADDPTGSKAARRSSGGGAKAAHEKRRSRRTRRCKVGTHARGPLEGIPVSVKDLFDVAGRQ